MKSIRQRISHANVIGFLAAMALAVGLHAQPALSINGESFFISQTGGPNGTGTLSLQGTCATLPATFTFQASGLASSGLNPSGTTFTESGNFTIAAGPNPGTFVMTAFQATFQFPITNPAGQVTGVKNLNLNPAPFSNQLFSCDSNLVNFNIWTTYTAQIATASTNSVDQGIANVILGFSFTQSSNYAFQETFQSSGSQLQSCVTPPSGLVSWWTAEGNANDIVSGNNGALQGGTGFASGEVGQAFNFNGTNSGVFIGDPANLRLTTGLTLDAWVNPNSIRPYIGNMAGIVTKWAQNYFDSPGSDSYGLWLIQAGGAGSPIGVFSGIHQPGNIAFYLQGGFGLVQLNTWTHVASTFDSSTGQHTVYVDGIPVISQTNPGLIFATSAPVTLGWEDTYVQRRFDGRIDEVEIFNRALSASEIQSIYAAGPAGKCNANSNQPAATTLVFTSGSATSSDFDDAAQVQARLSKSADSSPVAGKMVTFTLGSGGSAPTCSAMTDTTGTATCSLTPNEAAGTYALMASFSGDSNFSSSSASMPFGVTKEETVTKFTAGSPTIIANGSSATFSATLKEDGITPIAGRTLVFTLGTGSSAQSCSGATNGSGTASCSITVNQPLGPATVKVAFAGDGFYQPSSDVEAVTLFAFVGGGGSFVIGDLSATVGAPVTFWGAQWARANSLSGGPAPDAFKGFSDATSTAPPTCGGTWIADPANSTRPPASIPSYMAAIASSSIVKSGSAIAGDVARIIVIQVNPGYAADPGHSGTGTVVAVLPCR